MGQTQTRQRQTVDHNALLNARQSKWHPEYRAEIDRLEKSVKAEITAVAESARRIRNVSIATAIAVRSAVLFRLFVIFMATFYFYYAKQPIFGRSSSSSSSSSSSVFSVEVLTLKTLLRISLFALELLCSLRVERTVQQWLAGGSGGGGGDGEGEGAPASPIRRGERGGDIVYLAEKALPPPYYAAAHALSVFVLQPFFIVFEPIPFVFGSAAGRVFNVIYMTATIIFELVKFILEDGVLRLFSIVSSIVFGFVFGVMSMAFALVGMLIGYGFRFIFWCLPIIPNTFYYFVGGGLAMFNVVEESSEFVGIGTADDVSAAEHHSSYVSLDSALSFAKSALLFSVSSSEQRDDESENVVSMGLGKPLDRLVEVLTAPIVSVFSSVFPSSSSFFSPFSSDYPSVGVLAWVVLATLYLIATAVVVVGTYALAGGSARFGKSGGGGGGGGVLTGGDAGEGEGDSSSEADASSENEEEEDGGEGNNTNNDRGRRGRGASLSPLPYLLLSSHPLSHPRRALVLMDSDHYCALFNAEGGVTAPFSKTTTTTTTTTNGNTGTNNTNNSSAVNNGGGGTHTSAASANAANTNTAATINNGNDSLSLDAQQLFEQHYPIDASNTKGGGLELLRNRCVRAVYRRLAVDDIYTTMDYWCLLTWWTARTFVVETLAMDGVGGGEAQRQQEEGEGEHRQQGPPPREPEEDNDEDPRRRGNAAALMRGQNDAAAATREDSSSLSLLPLCYSAPPSLFTSPFRFIFEDCLGVSFADAILHGKLQRRRENRRRRRQRRAVAPTDTGSNTANPNEGGAEGTDVAAVVVVAEDFNNSDARLVATMVTAIGGDGGSSSAGVPYVSAAGAGGPSSSSSSGGGKSIAAMRSSASRQLLRKLKDGKPLPVSAERGDEKSCVVCLEHRPDVLFVPCGHVTCCVKCVRALATAKEVKRKKKGLGKGRRAGGEQQQTAQLIDAADDDGGELCPICQAQIDDIFYPAIW